MSIWFEQSHEQLRRLNTEFIERFPTTLTNTLKTSNWNWLDVIARCQTRLPTDLSKMKFPFTETLMPVSKRLFVKYISKAA